MRSRTWILAALVVAVAMPAFADPEYRVGRRDFNNLTYDELIVDSSPVQSAGGPYQTYPGNLYWWDLAADPGALSIWARQSGTSGSFATTRAMLTSMEFDDLVFTDGSGSGGQISVALNLEIDASASVSGPTGFPYLSVTSTGGGWGAWYPLSHSSGTQSTGIFTGLSVSDTLSGTFTGPAFVTSADTPRTLNVAVWFYGSAFNGTEVITESDVHFRPERVFELPPGYTVDSEQAGIVNNTWTGTPTGVAALDLEPVPMRLTNAPNPFTPSTSIRYALQRPATVRLGVYDASGALVRSLVHGAQPAGEHSVFWDGRSDEGKALSSGVYFSRLSVGASVRTRKMLMIR